MTTAPDTTRKAFRSLMAERRAFARGDPDHSWRTRACRNYVWMMRKVPVSEWSL